MDFMPRNMQKLSPAGESIFQPGAGRNQTRRGKIEGLASLALVGVPAGIIGLV